MFKHFVCQKKGRPITMEEWRNQNGADCRSCAFYQTCQSRHALYYASRNESLPGQYPDALIERIIARAGATI